MYDLNHSWTSDGASTAAFTPVRLNFQASYSQLSVSCSTIATTNSFQFQTAQESTGPWLAEGSTSISATASAVSLDGIRITGPYIWARPVLKTVSTGSYLIKLLAVGA